MRALMRTSDARRVCARARGAKAKVFEMVEMR